MSDDVIELTSGYWERRFRQSEARGFVLEAQLGAWEAQCSAQVAAAQAYLDSQAPAAHTPEQQAARAELERAIGTDAGRQLLTRFAMLQEELRMAQLQLTRASALALAIERFHAASRAAEIDPAAKPAAALAAFALGQALAAFRKVRPVAAP